MKYKLDYTEDFKLQLDHKDYIYVNYTNYNQNLKHDC